LKGLALNLAMAAASLFACALLVELALQLAMPLLFRPRMTRVDPVLGWYHNSSVTNAEEIEGHRYQLSYNSHGFRPPEHGYAKPERMRRVLVLGDSYTDGSEVDDRELFTWHLQNCLEGVEVINLGVYGFSTAQELVALERFGLGYSPDLVLLLSISNDLVENVLGLQSFGVAPRFVLEGDTLAFEGTDHPSARALFSATNLRAPRWIHQHSLLYYVLNHYIYHRLFAEKISETQKRRIATLTPAERVELYLRIVSRMRDITARSGAGLIVVLGYMRNELLGDEASPLAGIARQLAATGIQVVDLFGALRDAERDGERSLYYREDIHWNPRGHEVVAALLQPVVEHWMATGSAPAMLFEPPLGNEGCSAAAAPP
jgi:lysophospholipase L1-like esterase